MPLESQTSATPHDKSFVIREKELCQERKAEDKREGRGRKGRSAAVKAFVFLFWTKVSPSKEQSLQTPTAVAASHEGKVDKPQHL